MIADKPTPTPTAEQQAVIDAMTAPVNGAVTVPTYTGLPVDTDPNAAPKEYQKEAYFPPLNVAALRSKATVKLERDATAAVAWQQAKQLWGQLAKVVKLTWELWTARKQ